MSDKAPIIDINDAKKELENGMIKNVLEYVKDGTLPNNSPNSYLNAYDIVYNMSNRGEPETEALFEYYITTIQKFIEYCYIIVSKENGTQLLIHLLSTLKKLIFLFIGCTEFFII